MYSKLKVILALTILVLLISKCASALYKPTNYDAQKSGTSIDTLISGRKLYVEKCASCHSLYLPERYSKTEWKQIIDKMQERSGLTMDQKSKVLLFLENGTKD